VKKTDLKEYAKIRPTGLIAINLEKDDRLLSAQATSGNDDVLLVTRQGKSIRFHEKEIRVTGRATRGVKGITLKKNDFVVGADIIHTTGEKKAEQVRQLLTITENGYGKMTGLKEYSPQGRGGQGVFTQRVSSKTGNVVDMMIINKPKGKRQDGETNDEITDLLVVSTQGQTIRLPIIDIPSLGRHTQGVRIIRLNKDDKVAALAIL